MKYSLHPLIKMIAVLVLLAGIFFLAHKFKTSPGFFYDDVHWTFQLTSIFFMCFWVLSGMHKLTAIFTYFYNRWLGIATFASIMLFLISLAPALIAMRLNPSLVEAPSASGSEMLVLLIFVFGWLVTDCLCLFHIITDAKQKSGESEQQ